MLFGVCVRVGVVGGCGVVLGGGGRGASLFDGDVGVAFGVM